MQTSTRTVLAALLLGAWIALPAAAQDAQMQRPRVPGELLSSYMQAVRDTSLYAVAGQMKLKETTEAAEAWHKDLPVTAQLTARSLLADLMHMQVPLSDGSKADLFQEDARLEASPGLVLRVTDKEGQTKLYRVEPSDVAALRFRYVQEITVVDPANRPLDTVRLEQTELDKAVDFFVSSGNIDLAMGQRPREMPLLNLILRQKSAAEGLRFAAEAAGWSVRFEQNGRKSDSIPDRRIDVSQLRREFELVRLAGSVADADGKQVRTLLDYARMQFLAAARAMLEDRPVAILQVPASDVQKVRLR
jgi:hypothetical protein